MDIAFLHFLMDGLPNQNMFIITEESSLKSGYWNGDGLGQTISTGVTADTIQQLQF